MGCVYKAQDENGRIVALKQMSNRVTCLPGYKTLFYKEVESLRRMDSNMVVRLAGEPYGDSAGNLYLPMEFVNGTTIEQYVEKNGPMSEQKAIDTMCQILDAMQYVHDQNCIHRDIKPSNIMIRDVGGICIIDFGIAKDAKIGANGNTVGTIIGTDGYMSPEQASGTHIDKRTDIYSLGCLLFYMLTGRHAIVTRANNYETRKAILNEQMPLPSSINANISHDLDKVFEKAVDRDMTCRYQSPLEFKQALMAVDGPTVTIGRSDDNDIVIKSKYVSSHHLTVSVRKRTTMGMPTTFIEITDNSRNGTGIDGIKVLHGSKEVQYTDATNLPEVLLAGISDYTLDWDAVISRLKAKGWQPPGEVLPPEPPEVPTAKAGVGFVILSFLFPVVGWVLWAVWKDEKPRKAGTVATWAWIGFAINIISQFIVYLS